MRDTQAAKDLLYRRMRCHHSLDSANKNLDKATAKNKGVAEVFLFFLNFHIPLKRLHNSLLRYFGNMTILQRQEAMTPQQPKIIEA